MSARPTRLPILDADPGADTDDEGPTAGRRGADEARPGQPVLAAELYNQEGSPCASCTCSYQSLRSGAGASFGFDTGAGLTLRVCRVGRDPVVVSEGTEQLWCPDYSAFAELVPLPAAELETMQAECSRGFLGDLAQGLRPLPRDLKDLRWYDRALREGWLPAHRIEEDGAGRAARLSGPWEQFVIVGVTPAFGDGHTPAVAEAVLQAKDRRSYVLLREPDGESVSGPSQTHSWWVNQVSSGAAIPLESPRPATRGHRVLVLRGGERVLSRHAWRYLDAEALEAELDRLAADALRTARSALRRKNPVVARLCLRRGLRARPGDADLVALRDQLGEPE